MTSVTPLTMRLREEPPQWMLRKIALRCAVDLVVGMARPSEEGATFNDRDDVLGYADAFYAWLTGEDDE